MNELKFFYAFTPEDLQAQNLQAANKIDMHGCLLNPACNEKWFELDAEEIKILCAAIKKEEQAYSRHSHPLGKFSLAKVARITIKAAQSLHLPKPQYILRGSVLRQLLKKRHIKIYEAWSGQQITPLYQTNLKINNNDRDWVILVEHIKQLDAIRLLIDNGLSSHMAKNLKQEKINPAFIALNLAQAHRAAESSPPDSYAHKTAIKQGKEIRITDPDLLTKYVELCGYRRAYDKNEAEKLEAHAERVLGGQEESPPDDYNFTNTPPTTATPIHSLYINVTPLLDDDPGARFKLQSVLGPAARLQAVCDQVLGNLTRDPQHPAGPTDFVGSLSHFTLGGRAFEEGGIEDNFQALQEEAIKRQISWFELLASQLISRVKYHHRDEPAMLVAMTFNASAILAWKNPKLLEEIQQLWKIVLGQAERLENKKSFPHISSNPLIEHILMNMRDPNFRFIDLYVQLQATALIEQNRVKIQKGAYSIFSTQTDGHIFNQIAVPVQLGAGAPPHLYLFFPYDLLRSLKHLVCSTKTLSMLRHLHEVVISSKEIFFIREGSPLAGYYADPRRQSEQCFEESLKLLKRTDEWAWKTGFLVACSLLSQKKEDHFTKKLMLELMRMLLTKWPSVSFKKEMAGIFHQTLIKSGVGLTDTFFDKLIQPSERSKLSLELLLHIAAGCLKTDLAPFIDVAAECLNSTKGQESEKFHIDLYKNLGEVCASEELAANALNFLIDSLNRLPHISHNNKIELLRYLYQFKKVKDHVILGEKILEAILSNQADLRKLSAILDNFQSSKGPQLAAFWLDQLEDMPEASSFFSMLFHRVVDFFSQPEHAAIFPDELYCRLIKVAVNKQEAVAKTIVAELHRRGMTSEILALTLGGLVPCSEDNLKVLRDILSQLETIESVVDRLPEWAIEDEAISLQLMDRYNTLARHACEAGDCIKALHWFNQILLKNRPLDYVLAFQIFKGLVPAGKLQEASGLILSLPDVQGQEKTWLEVCVILLEARQAGACLQLIHQNPSINHAMKDPALSPDWLKIIGKAKDNMQSCSRQEIHQLCTLMGQVIRTLNSRDPLLWADYIQFVSKHGSLAQVEELFWTLQNNDLFSGYITRIKSCWLPIFERFHLEGSQAVVKLIGSATKVEKSKEVKFSIPILTEYSTENEGNAIEDHNFGNFYSHLVGAILKAIKLKNPKQQKKLAHLFFQSINMDVLIRKPYGLKGHQISLDVAEISLLGDVDQTLHYSLCLAVGIFVMLDKDPIAENAAVQIVNRGVKLALNSQELQVFAAAREAIEIVQKSDYCDDGDHFLFLEYLHKFENKIQIDRVLKAVQHSIAATANIDAPGLHFEEKLSSLTKIFQNPYTRRQYTPLQKSLVEKTFNQLHPFYAHFGEDLISLFDSSNLSSLTTLDTRAKIHKVKTEYHELTSVVKVIARYMRYCRVGNKAKIKASFVKRYADISYRYLPQEQHAIEKAEACNNVITVSLIVTVCALSFFLYLWQPSESF